MLHGEHVRIKELSLFFLSKMETRCGLFLTWLVLALFWSHGACHFSPIRLDTEATSRSAYVGPPSPHILFRVAGQVDGRRGGVVVHATSSHISHGSSERSGSCWARNFLSKHGAGRSCLRGGGHGIGCDGLVALRGAQENKPESSSSRAQEAEAGAERGSESGAPKALSEDERKTAMEYISQAYISKSSPRTTPNLYTVKGLII